MKLVVQIGGIVNLVLAFVFVFTNGSIEQANWHLGLSILMYLFIKDWDSR